MNLHFVQLEAGRSFRLNEFEKMVRLSPHSTHQSYLNVQEKRTLEVCLARWWSSLTLVETSYAIEFHSIICSPSLSLHLSSSQTYLRILLENHRTLTYENIVGLPSINWKCLVQTLRPNKDESKIQILSRRDCLSEQRQIYQLLFVYHLTLVSSNHVLVSIILLCLGTLVETF